MIGEDINLMRVAVFHQIFGHPVHEKPFLEDEDMCALRYSLLAEELNELGVAMHKKDAVETLDALCDLQYVLDGAFLALGFSEMKEDAMRQVQLSNLSKLGEDGQPIVRKDGKILKGPNYFAPDLKSIVEKYNG